MRFEDSLAEASSAVGRPSDEAVCVKNDFSSDLILPSRHGLDVFVFRFSALALELRALFRGQSHLARIGSEWWYKELYNRELGLSTYFPAPRYHALTDSS